MNGANVYELITQSHHGVLQFGVLWFLNWRREISGTELDCWLLPRGGRVVVDLSCVCVCVCVLEREEEGMSKGKDVNKAADGNCIL